MSFHKIFPVKKAHKHAPAPKHHPEPARGKTAPKRRPVSHQGR
ncbi:hypothetical protein ACFU90_05050 [Streptomyces noursei]|nr:hypothetical protein [Streptomyces noursei]